jgi:hypothetical protein
LSLPLIENETVKNALRRALADEEASRILASTISKPKSVVELIKECNLPHTSAYRLVSELKEGGLLVIERMVLTKDGKKYALYRSTFRSMTVRFDGGQVQVEADVNRDKAGRVFRLFYSLPEEKGQQE